MNTKQNSYANIYDSLLLGKKVTVQFSSRTDVTIFESNLRVAKSRLDKKFEALGAARISQGKVICGKILSEVPGEITVEFSLTESVPRKRVPFQIIRESDPDLNTASPQ